MKTKQLFEAEGLRTFAVIFDSGDEVKSGLEEFARSTSLSAATLSGIGAFERVTLGYFNWGSKEYDHIECDEQVEVVSLLGDVALKDGEPAVHAHLSVARSDASVLGGHLVEARVRPTLEVVVVEAPVHLHKQHDPTTGLALISVR